ncbi:unnamed protein product [Dovyalis caffra]|uniref:RNase H type-1 domain-containing protein n=1 Tax=Dovyalis caffra TaxID=77055 RepID=A0AAV1RH78_9ROSI|nr:unnamed protein product [Dovyalis caffra]
MLVSWVKRKENWVRLNTGGASKHNSGLASAGAEMWAASLGSHVAWQQGYRQVELEVDLATLVTAIKGSCESLITDPPFKEMVQLIHH